MEIFEVLSRKVLHESLNVQKGETVTIETWNNGLEFANEVVLEARRIGAAPLLLLEDEDTFVETAKTVPKEHLGIMGRHEFSLLSQTDAYVFIPGPPIAAYTRAITQEQRSASTAYNHSWYEAAEKAGLRGVRLSFGYVGKDLASLHGRSQRAMVNQQLRASLVDFEELKETGRRIKAQLVDGRNATVTTRAGKLSFTLQGDIVVEDGIVDMDDIAEGNNMVYMPPGRIRKHVDPNSVNGSVEISSAEIYSGRVEGIRLSFKEGKLVSHSAKRSPAALDDLVAKVPEDGRQISFIEVGMNPVLRYGNAQDRFVSGAITVGLPRLSGVMHKATLTVNGRELVGEGQLRL